MYKCYYFSINQQINLDTPFCLHIQMVIFSVNKILDLYIYI